MNINCIVLAAGLSRRMGKNKLLMPFRGKKLLTWTMATIQLNPFQEIILVTTNETAQAVSLPTGIKLVLNDQPQKGQSHSIHLGLQQSQKADGNMFFVADQPFLSAADIGLLIESFKQHPGKIIVPLYGGKKGSPTIFPSAMTPLLMNLSGDTGGRNIIKSYPEQIHYVSMPQSMAGTDIDTPVDYNIHGHYEEEIGHNK